MLLSTLKDFTAPYTEAEARIYDRVIAPAVARFDALLLDEYLARVPADGRVLEVGCGGGQLLRKVATVRPDLALTGLDLSPGQVGRARERTRDLEQVRAVEGSAMALPFEDGCFEAVMSVASIKHWPDPVAGLREALRVLVPGGALFVVEADRGCRPEDIQSFVRDWHQPRLLAPLGHLMFRMVVADRSPDLVEARGWLDELDLLDAVVRRIPGAPGLLMAGTKSA